MAVFQQPAVRATRRYWLAAVPAGLAGIAAYWLSRTATDAPLPQVTILQFDGTGREQGSITRQKIRRIDAEWRSRLSPQQFYVARRGTTDTPFTGTYYVLNDLGVFRCICCGTALFSSAAKYDSGTGWPSFRAPLAKENIYTREDHSLPETRTEVLCQLCDAHVGHVFDDGPPPTGLRYCMNESALRFVRS